ncbi:MAG TPA: hypothetical protein DEP84_18685 [Chloroflexi bacterium]|nr:hypothetical protein [Chloroflexota bacterium]
MCSESGDRLSEEESPNNLGEVAQTLVDYTIPLPGYESARTSKRRLGMPQQLLHRPQRTTTEAGYEATNLQRKRHRLGLQSRSCLTGALW